jgi:hypothetical protein
MVHRLDDILAPLGAAAFFADHAGREPVHLTGSAARVALPDWPALAELLNMSALWSAETLSLILNGEPVAPERYCELATDRELQSVQRPVATRVRALQADGAVLVARQVETLSNALKHIVGDLEAGFAGRAVADLHVHRSPAPASAATRALTDLLLLPVVGTFRVRTRPGAIPHPVPHAKFVQPEPRPDPAVPDPALIEMRLLPGERLYLPRGWIYALDTLSPDTAYVSFAITRPVGLDLLHALAELALDDPAFRTALPREAGAERTAWLAALGERFAALVASPEGAAAAARLEQGLQRDLASYDLPADGVAVEPTDGPRYKCNGASLAVVRTSTGWQLKGARGAVPIPAGRERLVAWVVERAGFSRVELADAFPDIAPALVEALLGELAAMKVIAAVS